MSASHAARCGPSRHAGILPWCRLSTSAQPAACTTWSGRSWKARASTNSCLRKGKLSPDVAAYYALQVAEALDVCHQQALFHGLLKPSNLMVGADNKIYILDFGIGCLLAETEGESLVDTMSTANSVTSGLDCASPESIMDPTNLTPAGDQYSLGCVLYYCLTGQYPFPDGSRGRKDDGPPIQGADADQRAESRGSGGTGGGCAAGLMQKAPENRYGSVAEVVEALRPLAEGASNVQDRVPSESIVLAAPARPAVTSAVLKLARMSLGQDR